MKIAASVLAAILALAGYCAWPYYSAMALREAMETRDAAAVSRMIDWPPFKASMKDLLTTEIASQFETDNTSQGMFALIGGLMIDRMVESMVSPQGLIKLINGGRATAAPVQRFRGDEIKRASLVGPTRFEFEVGPANSDERFFLGVMELRDFSWKLTQIMALKPISSWINIDLQRTLPTASSVEKSSAISKGSALNDIRREQIRGVLEQALRRTRSNAANR